MTAGWLGGAFAALWALLPAPLALAAPPPTGLRGGVAFAIYPALAESSELVRRLASPLGGAAMRQQLIASGRALEDHSVDLAGARFTVYVPPHQPSGGYGLLVFVPPWSDARVPRGWAGVLDRFGVIFVSAEGSGNEARTVSRREPLALIAEQNLAGLYQVDPARVWVAGFSGGGRVALRLALGYPDVFRGAMLNAGADPIGDSAAPLPPKDLFLRFQTSSRLVLVTGENDKTALMRDEDAMSSLRRWCVGSVSADRMLAVGHQVADPAALAWALESLQAPVRSDPNRSEACRAGIERDMATAFGEVDALVAQGKGEKAHKRLIALDARFGGLAAPRSVTLGAR